MANDEIRIVSLKSLPEISPSVDLARLIAEAARGEGHSLGEGCAVVVAQKVVSKAEGRLVNLRDIRPSPLADSFCAGAREGPASDRGHSSAGAARGEDGTGACCWWRLIKARSAPMAVWTSPMWQRCGRRMGDTAAL